MFQTEKNVNFDTLYAIYFIKAKILSKRPIVGTKDNCCCAYGNSVIAKRSA